MSTAGAAGAPVCSIVPDYRLAVFFAVLSSCVIDTEEPATLPVRAPSGVPGLGATADAIYVLASNGRNIQVARSTALGDWSGWTAIPGGPASGFRLDVAPGFRESDFAFNSHHIFALGNDGMIYRSIHDAASSTFSPMSPLPGVSGAYGRFTMIARGPHDVFAHSVAPKIVQVSLFEGDRLRASMSFEGDEIAISRDQFASFDTFVTVRAETKITIWAFDGVFEELRKIGSFDPGPVEDWTAAAGELDAGHVYVARTSAGSSGGSGEIVDYRFERPTARGWPAGAPFQLSSHRAGEYALGERAVRIDGRSKLVAWIDATPGVKAARFVPGGAGQWISTPVAATAPLTGRPVWYHADLTAPADPGERPQCRSDLEVVALGVSPSEAIYFSKAAGGSLSWRRRHFRCD